MFYVFLAVDLVFFGIREKVGCGVRGYRIQEDMGLQKVFLFRVDFERKGGFEFIQDGI